MLDFWSRCRGESRREHRGLRSRCTTRLVVVPDVGSPSARAASSNNRPERVSADPGLTEGIFQPANRVESLLFPTDVIDPVPEEAKGEDASSALEVSPARLCLHAVAVSHGWRGDKKK